ncbi:hypothetical protein CLIB1423_01S05248 [[Candida] railenensis]|uniref:Uncharacterized protein n=1 Tax=[Candida] railenensis TaxID=45579 RepID=A0A9P0QKT0_9ASCO|nr:hypothetical protein CLIB1423_01S05248 [[Candida] railenensis]
MYPNPLKAISRKLTDDIVITSVPFTRSNLFNFGGRMALLKFGDDIIVWSAIPHSVEVEKAIALFSSPTASVTHLIIPDQEHTLAAVSFKEKYPNLKIIGPETVDLGPKTPIDYKLTESLANKILDKTNLSEDLGVDSSSALNNLQFVYFPSHANKELVVYDTKSKILFEGDLLFNLGAHEPSEQYSPATGYAKDFNPHGGLSFLTRYMQPYSKVGGALMRKVSSAGTPQAKRGLQAIYSWDFEQVVPCHGNVISKNAKEAFANVFKSSLEK